MKMPKHLLALAIALLLPTVSWAITFELGNNPQPNEENVLLSNGTTGMLVTGVTNQSGFVINFTSTQVLSEPSTGQARIEATNNSSQVALANMSFSLANGGTFDDAIFNMFIGGTIGSPSNATITAVANDGTFQFTTALGNGSNFLTIFANSGEVINSISIDANGFTDLRQVRISGATAPTPVPDTGSTLALLSSGLSTLALLRRKRALN
jgi:hypothetical protein